MSDAQSPPAITRERAHVRRRDPAADEWPFREHRPMSDVMRAELVAAADHAGRRAEDAFDRARTP